MASLPIAQPQALTRVRSLVTKKDREQLLADIQQALEPFAVTVEITPYSNRHFVALFATPDLQADVDFDGGDPNPSMIHWCRARADLKPITGVFDECDISPIHRRKATSFPECFRDLVNMLEAGFAAATDGSAFR